MDNSSSPVEADPLEGLEDRLKSHAQAFESLLALTPARDYFGSHAVDGKDPSEQWNRKKQTAEERRAAKKAKLDPANQKSALDVLKEKEAEALRKRKRKDVEEDDDVEQEGGKRVKVDEDEATVEARRREKVERKREKRERKKEKKAAKRAKSEAKKAKKQELDLEIGEAKQQQQDVADDESDTNAEAIAPSEMEDMDFSGLAHDNENANSDEEMDDANSMHSSAPTTPVVDSPAFDLGTNHSAASSSSSIVPPSVVSKSSNTQSKEADQTSSTNTKTPNQDKSIKPTPTSTATTAPTPPLTPAPSKAEVQERLRVRIEALRAQRKADGPNGQPVRSRAELVEQRRQDGEKKKQAKKEQRLKEKEDESRRREEQLRGSGSPLSMDMFSPRSPQPTNYSFSRLAFQDGTAATSSLSGLQDASRKKGPSDPATALKAAQSKQSRLSSYDSGKRAEIEEKDSWVNARKKAQGERLRDDTSLLKKTLKRKEKQKGKSEKEWKERQENVVHGREVKQKKREANLAKRKDEKGGKGKKKGGAAPGGGGGKGKGGGKGVKKRRPGFEGRFKA